MAQHAGLAAVRPIACFPEELVLVTMRARGETLGTVLKQQATWWPAMTTLADLERTLARVGTWLRVFQATGTGARPFSLEGMREYVDVRLRRLVGMPLARVSEEARSRILAYFDERAGQVGPADLQQVPVHGDIAPSNILVERGGVTVLDFAMVTAGGKYHDVARLFTQLEFLTRKPKFRPAVIVRLQGALLEAFEPGLQPANPLFALFVLQHRLCHLANLASHPATGLSRAYNWYQRRGHLSWLQATAGAPGDSPTLSRRTGPNESAEFDRLTTDRWTSPIHSGTHDRAEPRS
jgi:aminoglycoside phosphotransferase (APT) family kinase protein